MVKQLEDDHDVINLESTRWKETEAIVVLACFYFEDEVLPFVSHWPDCSLQRNLHAALMYQHKPLPIYVAGGILGTAAKMSIANYNKSFFEKLGVQKGDIYAISEGTNTQSEATALAPFLKGKYISLVTSASHMTRAVSYFEKQGFKVLPIPVDHLSKSHIEPVLDRPNARSLYRSERAIHEYLGIIYQNFIL